MVTVVCLVSLTLITFSQYRWVRWLISKIRNRKTLREEIPHHPNSLSSSSRLPLIVPVSLYLCLLLALTLGSLCLSLAVFLWSKSFFLLYKFLVISLAFHHPFLSRHIPSTSLSPLFPLFPYWLWVEVFGKLFQGRLP